MKVYFLSFLPSLRRRSRNQSSRASREGHGRKKSISQHAEEGTESSKEVYSCFNLLNIHVYILFNEKVRMIL
jgi:hypothetical protein